MSLHDLKLSGSKEAPLEIFVDLDTSEVGNNGIADLTENTNVKSLWGFETTKRGICTLTTSLKMLIKEIEAGSYAMNKILGILFELTHFPPLLIAFVNLQKTDLEERRCSSDLRLLASALHILCLQIPPSSICSFTRNGPGIFPSGSGLVVVSRAWNHFELRESADQVED